MTTNAKTIRLFLRHAFRHKLLVFGLLSWLPILIVLHQVIPPIIAADVLDRLSAGDFIQNDLWGSFGNSLLTYSLLIIFTATLGWRLVIFLIWKMEIKVIRHLMNRVFDHLVSLDLEFHNNSFGGSLVSRSNKLMSSYIRLADTFVFEIYGLFIMSVATGVVLWSRAPHFVITFYVIAILYILFTIRATRYIRILSSIEASKQNKVTGYLADMVTNVMAVKSFARQDFENERFGEATSDVANAGTKLMWAQIHRDNIFAVFTSMIGALALILATASVVIYNAEIGTVFLVLSYATNMTARLWDFSHRALRNINRALGDAEEGIEMLDRTPEIADPNQPVAMPANKGIIEFRAMDFSHDDTPLFKDFSVAIEQGQKIGLVGHSGSGKTTLTKLLLRFKDISSGSILINGVDIRSVRQAELRSIISYVPQEPLLFHRSLKENIAYGKPAASMDEIIQSAKGGNAHEFIEKLPHGYDTLVGERGVKLSGGQKQRVAIARAMLKDAPILLLDEATSALDSESEQLIQDALWKLMKGRTAIVIAHRLSTIQKMDRIIVLDNGEIIEDGPHNELIKRKNGQYARLWRHQSGGFLID